jgi:hypothetical protein
MTWDKDEKKFIRNVRIDLITTQNTKQGFKLKSKFELFLSSGEKDNAGKEIYEGHILEVSCHPHLHRTFVSFEDGAFRVNMGDEVKNLATAIGKWNRMDATTTIVGHIKTHKL